MAFKIIDVNAENVDQVGFFCYMSKKKAVGYTQKLNWLKARFAEGMRIKMVELPERGFIEYIPGEYTWRSVQADGYMVIHCLWVVGKSKGKGLGAHLINLCIEDARQSGMHGVVMVTSEGNWLIGKKLLEKSGFESVDHCPPSFHLMVKKFKDAPLPSFIGGWDSKLGQYGDGLTVIRADQCPYIEDATTAVLETTKELGIDARVVTLKSSADIRRLSPTPFGVFSIIYRGRLLSYHYQLKKDLIQLIKAG